MPENRLLLPVFVLRWRCCQHDADFIAHPRLQERPVQHAATAQHQGLNIEFFFQLGKSQTVIQFRFARDNIRNSLLSQKGSIGVADLFCQHLDDMGGGVHIVQGTAFPPKLAVGGYGNIEHSEVRLRNEITCRNSRCIFVQIRLFIEGEVIVRCHSAGQPALMMIKRFFPEGDVIKHIARRAALQMVELQHTMEMVDYKCWYYETAKEAGTVDAPQKMELSEVPERFRKIRQELRTAPGTAAEI